MPPMPRSKRPPLPPSKVPTLIANAFTSAQRTTTSHPHALSLLHTAFSQSPNHFLTHFIHALNRVLLIYQRLPHVERLIHFITLTTSTPPFVTPILVYLLQNSNAVSPSIRFRIMQILAGTLSRLEQDADLNDQLYNSILDVVTIRIKDRVPRVRAAAAAAMCRLQTDGDLQNDPIAAHLARLCATDSSAAVRKAALKAFAINDSNFHVVLARTRDVRPDVRREAYEVLARRISPEVFPVPERLRILNDGLRDRDDACRKVVGDVLLVEGWLKGACEWDVVKLTVLLGGMDRDADVLKMLRVVMKQPSCKELLDAVNVDIDALSMEDVLVMRAMAEVLGEGVADRFFDDTKVYVDVLRYYRDARPACKHLLEMSRGIDMADESGRKALEALLRFEFLSSPEVDEETAESAVRALRRVMLEEEATLRILLEIVSYDLLNYLKDEAREGSQGLQEGKQDLRGKPPSGGREQGHEKSGEISAREETSEARDQEWKQFRALVICREALRLCRQGQSFASATMSLCTSLMEQAVVSHLMNADNEMRYIALETFGLYCLLDNSGLEAKRNLPLFIRACKADVQEIQELAVQIIVDLLMLFDFSDDPGDDGERHESDHPQRNSMTRLSVHLRKSNAASFAEECVTLLSQNLAHQEAGHTRTLKVQGLARLLYLRRINPTGMLLSSLLIAHHNPNTEGDEQLRQCLSVFFPVFAAASSSNRLRLEDAFTITVDHILGARSANPVSQISVVQVAQFIIYLTSPKTSSTKQNGTLDDVGRPADQIHERLAETVLNRMLDAIESFEMDICRTYGRMLSNFRLTCNAGNMAQIALLRKLAQRGVQDCEDKRMLTVIKRFRDRLDSALEQAEAAGIVATAITPAKGRHVKVDGNESEGSVDGKSEEQGEDATGETVEGREEPYNSEETNVSMSVLSGSFQTSVQLQQDAETTQLIEKGCVSTSGEGETATNTDVEGSARIPEGKHGQEASEEEEEYNNIRPRRTRSQSIPTRNELDEDFDSTSESEDEEWDEDYVGEDLAFDQEGPTPHVRAPQRRSSSRTK